MLKRMRRIGLFVLAIAVVISSAIIASANERSGTNGSATTQSTTSSYVIENKSSDKKNITVTIQHYNGSKKIYSDDVKTLSYGSKINDYAKAINWNVSSVTVDGNAVTNKNYIELKGTGSATVVVNYTTETTYSKPKLYISLFYLLNISYLFDTFIIENIDPKIYKGCPP